MENEDNPISEISNKENYYKFDNYGNVMADSIEDLLYDKYMIKKNKNIKGEKESHQSDDNNSNEMSISSSMTKGKQKENDDITISKNINIKYNPDDNKKVIKSSSSSNNILNLINEEKNSGTDDKFLESNILENKKNEITEENGENENNTLEGNDIFPQINKNLEIIKNKNENNDEIGNNEDGDVDGGKDKRIKIIMNVHKDEKISIEKYDKNNDNIYNNFKDNNNNIEKINNDHYNNNIRKNDEYSNNNENMQN